jgi:hypothetical protein
VGESVASLEATPTLYVTTRSLPALTAYGRELRAAQVGDWISVAERAREATTLDPEFAEAHRHLGIALSNIGVRRAERVQAFTRAYALRDRLSPYERGLAEASYFSYALGDDRRAAERYRAMVPEFPLLVTPRRGTTPRNNLYTVYNRLGEWALALRVSRALVDSVPTLRVFRRNHVEALITAGALDAADTAVRSMARDFPGQSITAVAAAWVAAARRDYAGALAVVDSALRTADPQSTGRVDLLGQQRTVTATLGRLAARARADAELAGEYSRLGGGPELLTLAAEQAQVEAALGRPDRARAALGAALGRYPLAWPHSTGRTPRSPPRGPPPAILGAPRASSTSGRARCPRCTRGWTRSRSSAPASSPPSPRGARPRPSGWRATASSARAAAAPPCTWRARSTPGAAPTPPSRRTSATSARRPVATCSIPPSSRAPTGGSESCTRRAATFRGPSSVTAISSRSGRAPTRRCIRPSLARANASGGSGHGRTEPPRAPRLRRYRS